MASKEQTIKVHAKRRFDERYGVKLTDGLHKELVNSIQSATLATFICTQSNRVSVWAVQVAAKHTPNGVRTIVPVAYDKIRKMLITALPVACLDVNQIGNFSQESLI